MNLKGKLFTFFSTMLIAALSVFFVAQSAANAEGTGSISVCKIVVDQNNNIVTGSDRPGESFSISGFTPSPETSQGTPAGVLPTTNFTTPIALDSHILAGGQGNDSQCFTYGNLALGNYYWSQESNSTSGWDMPFYSDQFTGPAKSVVNLYSYDGNLFDGNQANDGTRNLDADGHIVLTQDRPNRILIVANRYKAGDNQPGLTQISANTSSNGGGTSGGGSGVTFTCNDTSPSSAPELRSIVSSGQNSVTLTWTGAGDPVSYYYINYGTEPGKYIYGITNVGGKGTTKYTINGLSGGVTYYFVVGAGNGCKPGSYSNELSGTPSGLQVTTVPAGFTAVVLGTAATSSKLIPTGSQGVKGLSTLTNGIACGSCIWWPILLGEVIALILFYGVFRKSIVAQRRKYFFGFLIGAVAYIIFLIFNRNCMGSGVMRILWLSIPCKYFWVVDGIVYTVLSFIFRVQKPEKASM